MKTLSLDIWQDIHIIRCKKYTLGVTEAVQAMGPQSFGEGGDYQGPRWPGRGGSRKSDVGYGHFRISWMAWPRWSPETPDLFYEPLGNQAAGGSVEKQDF